MKILSFYGVLISIQKVKKKFYQPLFTDLKCYNDLES